uniref:Uncharacterized protein n=1 Tax=Geospiza parvula TaxID=87175 RepID=A0A8U8AX84_GEOPR
MSRQRCRQITFHCSFDVPRVSKPWQMVQRQQDCSPLLSFLTSTGNTALSRIMQWNAAPGSAQQGEQQVQCTHTPPPVPWVHCPVVWPTEEGSKEHLERSCGQAGLCQGAFATVEQDTKEQAYLPLWG